MYSEKLIAHRDIINNCVQTKLFDTDKIFFYEKHNFFSNNKDDFF